MQIRYYIQNKAQFSCKPRIKIQIRSKTFLEYGTVRETSSSSRKNKSIGIGAKRFGIQIGFVPHYNKFLQGSLLT